MAMTVITVNNPFKRPPVLSWRDRLTAIYEYLAHADLTDYERDNILEIATRRMQQHYPGPYSVEKLAHGFKLKFNDASEETMWMLKWP